MQILVLNCGSSSVKYQLLEMNREEVICKGIIERIGTDDAILRYQPTGRPEKHEVRPVATHAQAIAALISAMMDPETGVIKDLGDIAAVGHRTVHGGEAFADSVQVSPSVLESIEACAVFAPLHNPHNLEGIKACMNLLPGTPQVAVFDTAFHQSMPPTSYLYALPYTLYEKMKVRRYGFHGTSHLYVAQRAAEELGQPIERLRIITCHLGNGASITAVKAGKSIDTSMGFTPLEGLVMGTRCGDIDPALVLHIMNVESLSPQEMDELLNRRSGLLGLSGISHDMREIQELAEKGDKRAGLALGIYCYRIRKYIGAYVAAMGGVDAVVFTGGVGENSHVVRRQVCTGMEFLGIVLDDDANIRHSPLGRSRPDSLHISTGKTKVLVIATNEELVIARDTKRILFG